MRYFYLIALASTLAMPTVSTFSQEPAVDQGLSAGRSRQDSPRRSRRGPRDGSLKSQLCKGLFAESGLAYFRLNGGRILLDPVRYRKGQQTFECDGFRESMTVSCSGGVPSIYYQFQDEYQQVRLSAECGRCLRLESTLIATGERAILTQEVGEPIRWETIREKSHGKDHSKDHREDHREDLSADVQGSTLLHIVAMDQAGFQIHLENIMQRLLRGRSVINIAEQTQQQLVNQSDELMSVSKDQVRQLIEQLRAPRVQQRRKAAIELTRMASFAVPHLQSALASGQLDQEQATRISSILKRQNRLDDDTPASLACLLSADEVHWQSIVHRMDQHQWLAANRHLQNCGLSGLEE